MKIIKYGLLPESKTYRIQCDYCKTIFEFSRREAEYKVDFRDGDFLTIKCPLCKKHCFISIKVLNKYQVKNDQ